MYPDPLDVDGGSFAKFACWPQAAGVLTDMEPRWRVTTEVHHNTRCVMLLVQVEDSLVVRLALDAPQKCARLFVLESSQGATPMVKGCIVCTLPSAVDWEAPVSSTRLVDHTVFRMPLQQLGPTQVALLCVRSV